MAIRQSAQQITGQKHKKRPATKKGSTVLTSTKQKTKQSKAAKKATPVDCKFYCQSNYWFNLGCDTYIPGFYCPSTYIQVKAGKKDVVADCTSGTTILVARKANNSRKSKAKQPTEPFTEYAFEKGEFYMLAGYSDAKKDQYCPPLLHNYHKSGGKHVTPPTLPDPQEDIRYKKLFKDVKNFVSFVQTYNLSGTIRIPKWFAVMSECLKPGKEHGPEHKD